MVSKDEYTKKKKLIWQTIYSTTQPTISAVSSCKFTGKRIELDIVKVTDEQYEEQKYELWKFVESGQACVGTYGSIDEAKQQATRL